MILCWLPACLLLEEPLRDLLRRDTRLHARWCQLPPLILGLLRTLSLLKNLVDLVGLGLGVKYGDKLVSHSLVVLGPGNVALEGLA